MRGLGNRLRHEYDGISSETLWQIVTDNLGPLAHTDIRAALLEIASEDAGWLLAPELYDDPGGFGRLLAWAGDRELALRTITAISSSAELRKATSDAIEAGSPPAGQAPRQFPASPRCPVLFATSRPWDG